MQTTRLPATLCVLGATAMLSACTTLGMAEVSKPALPAVDKAPFNCADACKPADARQSLSTALDYCAHLAEFYDRNGNVTIGQRLFIGITGSLAGSVFAVASSGAAAKAWAGLSGATNGLQTQLDSSQVGSRNMGRVEKIALHVKAARAEFSDDLISNRAGDAVLKARFLVTDCATAPPAPTQPASAPA